jgi:hypothetical protein
MGVGSKPCSIFMVAQAACIVVFCFIMLRFWVSNLFKLIASHQSKGYRAEERRRNSPRDRGTTESGIERRMIREPMIGIINRLKSNVERRTREKKPNRRKGFQKRQESVKLSLFQKHKRKLQYKNRNKQSEMKS